MKSILSAVLVAASCATARADVVKMATETLLHDTVTNAVLTASNNVLTAANAYTDAAIATVGGVTRTDVTNIVDAVVASSNLVTAADAANAVPSVVSNAFPIVTNAYTRAETEAEIESNAHTNGGAKAYADAGFVPWVRDRYGSLTAVTIGSRGEGTVGVSSFVNGAPCIASGALSHAEGSLTIASGALSHAEGSLTIASGASSHADGIYAISSNSYSFAWNGAYTPDNYYGSHGEGTFNLNPVGGLCGLWIGETNLADHISGYTNGLVTASVTNGLVTAAAATNAAETVFSENADYALANLTAETLTLSSGQIGNYVAPTNFTLTLEFADNGRSGDCLAYVANANAYDCHVTLLPNTLTYVSSDLAAALTLGKATTNVISFTRVKAGTVLVSKTEVK